MKPIKPALRPVRGSPSEYRGGGAVNNALGALIPTLNTMVPGNPCPGGLLRCRDCNGTGSMYFSRKTSKPCPSCEGLGRVASGNGGFGCSWLAEGNMTYLDVIVHLNDDHCWTLEQLADWLDAQPLDFVVPKPMRWSHTDYQDGEDDF